jgi:copper(I)-binding protein
VSLVSRRPLALVAPLACAAVLAGCGTGLEPKTYQETGRQDGAFATVGGRQGVHVQRLMVSGPVIGSTFAAGETAVATGGLVNNSKEDDALVGATSDVSPAVTLLVDGQPVQQVPIPAGGVAPAGWSLGLTSLSRELHVGTYITISLELQRAGKITLRVPVEAGDNGLTGRTPEEDPYSEG